jgi:hypothetical protein
LNRVDGVSSQRSSKVFLSFNHRLQIIDLLDKKVWKGELLKRQLPEICSLIQFAHHFIRNMQQNNRSEVLIFLLRREADLIVNHCQKTADSSGKLRSPTTPMRLVVASPASPPEAPDRDKEDPTGSNQTVPTRSGATRATASTDTHRGGTIARIKRAGPSAKGPGRAVLAPTGGGAR